MSNPRIIKNNDGVAVVEGTPAASLIKDADKFFATKPPERMAGESIGQPRKIDENRIMSKAEYEADATRRINEAKKKGIQISPGSYSRYLERQQPGYQEKLEASIQKEKELIEQEARKRSLLDARRDNSGRDPNAMRDSARNVNDARRDNSGRDPDARRDFTNRNEAKERAESRRKRFFERARSRREAERSQAEQKATEGKFITTLGR